MRKLDSNAHSVFLLYYHLILVIKYRKKILTDPVSERAREIFEYIAPKYHVTFWSQSFCLLSAGGAPIEVIRQYIETQGEKKSEHRVPFSDLPE